MSITNETDRQWQQANAHFQRSYRQGKEMMNQLNLAGLELKALRTKHIDYGMWISAVGRDAGEGFFAGSYQAAMRCIWVSNNWIHFEKYMITVINDHALSVRGFRKYLVPGDEEIDTYEEDFLDIPFEVITDIKVSHEVERQLLRIPVFEDRQRVWQYAIEAYDVASDLPTAAQIQEIIDEWYGETPESPPADDSSSMGSSEPSPLANGLGGSPAPTEAEQVILDRLLKPGETVGFESGLDHEYAEYLCYLCKNWFLIDQVKTLRGNRYCYSCREQLPDPGDAPTANAPVYETTLFDEVPPAVEEPPGTSLVSGSTVAIPETNGQATSAPPAMAVQDPYEEMIMLAKILFPKFSSMECMSTYGITGEVRRFIDLFTEIHQVKT